MRARCVSPTGGDGGFARGDWAGRGTAEEVAHTQQEVWAHAQEDALNVHIDCKHTNTNVITRFNSHDRLTL